MSLSTALKSIMAKAFHGIGTAEELATAVDNSTTAVGQVTAAEMSVLHSVTPGTALASSAVVVGANKQIDTVAVATPVVGANSTPGSATQATRLIFKKTAIVDNTPTSILTVTCPNATHTAALKLTVLAAVNNSGALDSARGCETVIAFSRIAGAALVGSTSVPASIEASIATSGTATLAAFNLALAAVGGAVGATNTMDVQVTLVKTGGTNHQIVVLAELINSEASGMTMAAA